MGCGCNSSEVEAVKSYDKTLKIDFLFLDEEVCAPCGGTLEALRGAIDIVKPSLETMGIALELNKVHVVDETIAICERFLSSPTIRINGLDIDPARTQDDCPTCGSLAGDEISVSCRTWHWKGEVYQAAPVGKIIEEIMAASVTLSTDSTECCEDTCCSDDENMDKPVDNFVLPDNLKGFFRLDTNV